MNLNDFARKVAKEEGGSKQVSIAQIKEILRVTNDLLKGALYALVKGEAELDK